MATFTPGNIVTTTKRIPNAAIDYASYANGNYSTSSYGYFPAGTKFLVTDNVNDDGDLPTNLIVKGIPIKNRNSSNSGAYFIDSCLLSLLK